MSLFSFAKTLTEIPDETVKVIMHSRKSLLFSDRKTCVKQTNHEFDVPMGSYDGEELCEIVGIYILHKLEPIFGKNNVGLYRMTAWDVARSNRDQKLREYVRKSPGLSKTLVLR